MYVVVPEALGYHASIAYGTSSRLKDYSLNAIVHVEQTGKNVSIRWLKANYYYGLLHVLPPRLFPANVHQG